MIDFVDFFGDNLDVSAQGHDKKDFVIFKVNPARISGDEGVWLTLPMVKSLIEYLQEWVTEQETNQ